MRKLHRIRHIKIRVRFLALRMEENYDVKIKLIPPYNVSGLEFHNAGGPKNNAIESPASTWMADLVSGLWDHVLLNYNLPRLLLNCSISKTIQHFVFKCAGTVISKPKLIVHQF